MNAQIAGFPVPGPRMRMEDFQSAVIAFLNVESAAVARSMDRFRHAMLSDLNDGAFVCACPGQRNPGTLSETEDRHKGARPRASTLLGFSPFYYYPFLFHTAFSPVPMEFLRALALGNRILMEAIVLVDDRIDSDRAMDPMDLFFVDGFYQKSLELLVPFLPAQSPFWTQCERLFLEYGRAVIRELTFHRHRINDYPREEFYSIAVGKAGLIKTTVAALGIFSGQAEHQGPMIRSQEDFLAGFQAFDDLKDWREDYERQNYTFLLTHVLQGGGFAPAVEAGTLPDPEEVGRHLYFSGSAEAQLDMAERLFRKSISAVEGLCLPLWEEIVRGFLENTRAMRRDLEEIRQRESRRADAGKGSARSPVRRKAVDKQQLSRALASGARFMERVQKADGGFVLASSPYGYMNPYTPVGTSQAVTTLVARALASSRGAHPGLCRIVDRASGKAGKACPAASCSLPLSLERAFRPFTSEELCLCDGTFRRILEGPLPDDGSIPLEGFFWANIFHEAVCRNLAVPALEGFVLKSIQTEDYVSWIRGFDPQTKGRGNVLTLLLVYLFCRSVAAGPADSSLWNRKKEFEDLLLAQYRTQGTWGDVTKTALGMNALLYLGVHRPELQSAVERILQGQEEDGSWPPNVFYSDEHLCYGSRELTTAWCMEAISLHGKEAPVAATGHRHLRAGKSIMRPRPVLHPGVPQERGSEVRSVLEGCGKWVRHDGPVQVFLGTWDSMPEHFLFRQEGRAAIGINLAPPSFRLSTCRRPLRTEVLLAYVQAARWENRMLSGTSLEAVFLAGIALFLCRHLWPGEPEWKQAGMHRLDWQWCLGNEWHLRETVKQSLCGDKAGPEPAPPFVCPPRTMSSPSPQNAELYLGMQMVREETASAGVDAIPGLLSWNLEEILVRFRRMCGEKPNRKGPRSKRR